VMPAVMSRYSAHAVPVSPSTTTEHTTVATRSLCARPRRGAGGAGARAADRPPDLSRTAVPEPVAEREAVVPGLLRGPHSELRVDALTSASARVDATRGDAFRLPVGWREGVRGPPPSTVHLRLPPLASGAPRAVS
jgi:hypothetical protein